MSGFFSKPKAPSMPAVPPPPPIPTTDNGVEDATMKQVRRRNGFEKTLLTGDLVPKTRKKTLLG